MIADHDRLAMRLAMRLERECGGGHRTSKAPADARDLMPGGWRDRLSRTARLRRTRRRQASEIRAHTEPRGETTVERKVVPLR